METAESLGREPEDQPLQFLRRVTPLLPAGDWQLDFGIRYTFAETDFPAVAGVPPTLARARLRQRVLEVPLEFRYGLNRRTQLFTFVPVGWSNSELAYVNLDETANSGGVGDVVAGITYLLREGDSKRPDVVGTFAVTAPTGNAAFPTTVFSPEAQLGQGFWALSGNVLVIHTYDPLVVFCGLGMRYRFEHEFAGGLQVDPGEQYSYQLGVGFAVTSHVTLSSILLGSYIVEDHINADRIEGGNLEPIRMRLAATIARPCLIVEPYADIGMTNDAPAAVAGITWTY